MDPLRALQTAARDYGEMVQPGVHVGRVIIQDANGQQLAALAVPATSRAEHASTPAAPLPGWDFSRATPRLDGTEVPIYGRPLTVLKILANAGGPVLSKELAKAWDRYEPSESTVRGQIAELREKLKELFPLREEQITFIAGAGYQLEIR
jgi:DNA-binding response OmpR family regulator